ncbi:hypothetical protein ALC60_08235, partial [Trachymyrmex zeteki]
RCGLEAEYLRVNGNPPVCLQTSETGFEGSLCERTRPIHGLSDRAKEPSSMGRTKRAYTRREEVSDENLDFSPTSAAHSFARLLVRHKSPMLCPGNISINRSDFIKPKDDPVESKYINILLHRTTVSPLCLYLY